MLPQGCRAPEVHPTTPSPGREDLLDGSPARGTATGAAAPPATTRCGRKGSPHTTQCQGQWAQGLQPACRSRGHACYFGSKILFLLLATELHFLRVFPPFNKNTEAHQVRSQHPAFAQTGSKKTQQRARLARTPSTGRPQARSRDVRSWRPETELCLPESPGTSGRRSQRRDKRGRAGPAGARRR